MRVVFLLLIFANLLFFAWAHGIFGQADSGHEPQRLAAQLHPDKLSIVASTLAATASAPPAAASSVTASAVIASSVAATADACRSVGKLRAADAQRLLTLVGQSLTGAVATPQAATEAWDVLIPNLASRAAVDAKLSELKKLGVADARLQSDGKTSSFSLLLATDTRKSEAEDRLQMLTRKGVKSAKLVQHPAPDESAVQVRGAAPQLARLADLTRDMPGAVIGDCKAN